MTLGAGKRTILLYGALGGLLIVGLKLAQYRFLVVEHSLEIYAASSRSRSRRSGSGSG